MRKEKTKIKKEDIPVLLNISPSDHLVVHPEKCSGCEVCVLICSLFHNGVFSPSLARIKIPKVGCVDYMIDVCRQCLAPDCMYTCPVGAIYVDPKTGCSMVAEKKCNGCKKCVDACLFGMMFFDEVKNVAFKCDLCGGDPQCVKYCTMKAIEYVKAKK